MSDDVKAILATTLPEPKFKFLEALLADEDFSIAAAERACGLTPRTGSRWLQDARVRQVLAQLIQDRVSRNVELRDKVVVALWTIATYDPRQAWDERGQQIPPHKLPAPLAAALLEARPVLDMTGEVKGWHYKFSDRAKILTVLLQHLTGREDQEKQITAATDQGRVRVVFRGVDEGAIEFSPKG